jgi:hypothetical protein
MAHLISAQLISRLEGWLAYRSIYLPSMSYSLPSTSTRRELATIRAADKALLSAEWVSTGTCRWRLYSAQHPSEV